MAPGLPPPSPPTAPGSGAGLVANPPPGLLAEPGPAPVRVLVGMNRTLTELAADAIRAAEGLGGAADDLAILAAWIVNRDH